MPAPQARRPPRRWSTRRAATGLDVQRFRIDLGLERHRGGLRADLEETRSSPHGAREAGRLDRGHTARAASGSRSRRCAVRRDGATSTAAGRRRSYEDWRAAAIAAGAPPRTARAPTRSRAERFGRLATAEVEAVCDLPEPAAAGRALAPGERVAGAARAAC